MRQVKRISVINEMLQDENNRRKLLNYWFKPKEGEQMKIDSPYYHIDTMLENWQNAFWKIYGIWKDNPDLRLTQVLVSCGIVPNFPGFWFYLEDEKSIIESGIAEPRDVLFWGQNYDKDMNRLSETNWILIKFMTSDHIAAILLDVFNGKMSVSEVYKEAFINESKIRNNVKEGIRKEM